MLLDCFGGEPDLLARARKVVSNANGPSTLQFAFSMRLMSAAHVDVAELDRCSIFKKVEGLRLHM